mmetsp:Transcript_102721/g.291000  ORF Transcript_102721/g.291000 Transcript_102721/m.291000 type:complete len:318 (-) Transcript_102721:1265-2218(-)
MKAATASLQDSVPAATAAVRQRPPHCGIGASARPAPSSARAAAHRSGTSWRGQRNTSTASALVKTTLGLRRSGRSNASASTQRPSKTVCGPPSERKTRSIPAENPDTRATPSSPAVAGAPMFPAKFQNTTSGSGFPARRNSSLAVWRSVPPFAAWENCMSEKTKTRLGGGSILSRRSKTLQKFVEPPHGMRRAKRSSLARFLVAGKVMMDGSSWKVISLRAQGPSVTSARSRDRATATSMHVKSPPAWHCMEPDTSHTAMQSARSPLPLTLATSDSHWAWLSSAGSLGSLALDWTSNSYGKSAPTFAFTLPLVSLSR